MTRYQLARFGFTAGCVLLAFTFPVRCAHADHNQMATCYSVNVRTCDEIWLVSTDRLDPCKFTPNQFCVQQLLNGVWHSRTVCNLLETHQQQLDKPMVMYVHGNRLDVYWARRRGLETYQDLTECHTSAPPIRYVVWAWPSFDNDRMALNYPKILKRSIKEGNALGWFLVKAGNGDRIGVLSYSLGTQVLGGASEVSASRYGVNCACRAVAIGSATACRWPETPQKAHAVLSGVSSMLVVESREDSALKTYKQSCRLRQPCSEIGLALLQQYDVECKMSRLDATEILGEQHQIHEYLMHGSIARPVVDHLIGRCRHSVQSIDTGQEAFEVVRHCEPGNPASNPRRKIRSIK